MRFTELKVWQESKELVKKIYLLTSTFPKEEQYELVRRLRKVAITAPSNIAKGVDGSSDEEMIYYLGMARKNQADIGSQLQICKELGYLTEKELASILVDLTDCQKLTYGFMRYFRNKGKEEQSDTKKSKSTSTKVAA